VAPARRPERASELVRLGVEVVPGDVTVKDSIRQSMRGVDGVFHLAGWYRVGARDRSPAHRINVDGTRNVLELMRELEIPRGVYTSTLAIYSDTHGRLVDETYDYHGPWLTEYDPQQMDRALRSRRADDPEWPTIGHRTTGCGIWSR
jgi:nucleoside-diphosphate-sugar epimerase